MLRGHTEPKECLMSLAPATALLARLHPIATLSAPRQIELAALCHVEHIAAGLNPFRLQALAGQAVYLISGELELNTGSNTIIHSAPNQGLIQPLPNRTALFSATARTPLQLLRIDEDLLDIFLTWDQLYPAQQAATANTETQPEVAPLTANHLRFSALSRLPAAQYENLLPRLEKLSCPAGTTLITEGEVGDYYYLLVEGGASVSRLIGGAQHKLADIGPGGSFGEEALVSDNPRNATVTLTHHSVLYRLAKSDFDTLLKTPLLNEVSEREARTLIGQGAVWLDVRYPSEYQFHHLPGAINVPLGEIRHAIGKLPTDTPYVCYCTSGRRSQAAAFLLAQHGYQVSALAHGLWSLSTIILDTKMEQP